MDNTNNNLSIPKIEETLEMLNKHTDEPNLAPLIEILEGLKQDITNQNLMEQLTETWRNLGVYQGMVLTYVPYFYTLIPDDIFGDNL